MLSAEACDGNAAMQFLGQVLVEDGLNADLQIAC